MKTILTSILILFSIASYGQIKTVKTADGNYTQVSTAKTKVPAKSTGHTFTDSKGVKYPVYESAKGRLFITRVSKKSGAEYKVYLN